MSPLPVAKGQQGAWPSGAALAGVGRNFQVDAAISGENQGQASWKERSSRATNHSKSWSILTVAWQDSRSPCWVDCHSRNSNSGFSSSQIVNKYLEIIFPGKTPQSRLLTNSPERSPWAISLTPSRYGLTCPQKVIQVPQNVAIFEDRVFKEVIMLKGSQ